LENLDLGISRCTTFRGAELLFTHCSPRQFCKSTHAQIKEPLVLISFYRTFLRLVPVLLALEKYPYNFLQCDGTLSVCLFKIWNPICERLTLICRGAIQRIQEDPTHKPLLSLSCTPDRHSVQPDKVQLAASPQRCDYAIMRLLNCDLILAKCFRDGVSRTAANTPHEYLNQET